MYHLSTVQRWACILANSHMFLPQYYNFFLRRKRVILIIHPEFEKQLRAIFQETLFGPLKIDLSDEYSVDFESMPDLPVGSVRVPFYEARGDPWLLGLNGRRRCGNSVSERSWTWVE